MDDLERRLADALRALPEGDPATRERAQRSAMEAIGPAGRGMTRSPLGLAVVVALASVLATGVALATTGRLQVSLGSSPAAQRVPAPPAPATTTLALPSGAHGLAAVIGGRLWLRTRSGLGISGLAVTAAELSPNALYVAVGIGRSLVAMSPDGRRAWSRSTGGRVVAAAWAPNPILIAYVVAVGSHHHLHLIEGDGSGDTLVDDDVAPVRPTWGADTQSVEYLGADGSLRTLDRRTGAIVRAGSPPPGPPAKGVVLARASLPGDGGSLVAVPATSTAEVVEVREVAPSPRLLLRVEARPGPVSLSVR